MDKQPPIECVFHDEVHCCMTACVLHWCCRECLNKISLNSWVLLGELLNRYCCPKIPVRRDYDIGTMCDVSQCYVALMLYGHFLRMTRGIHTCSVFPKSIRHVHRSNRNLLILFAIHGRKGQVGMEIYLLV